MPCNTVRSSPEQNPLPAPRSTSTRQLPAAAASIAAINSSCISEVRAFLRSGRFRVIVRTAPSSATRIVAYATPALSSTRQPPARARLIYSSAEPARDPFVRLEQCLVEFKHEIGRAHV